MNDPIKYIAERMGLPEETVVKVLAGLKAYEVMSSPGEIDRPALALGALKAHLASVKADWESNLLGKFPREQLERAKQEGLAVSAPSRAYPGETIWALADDGTYDLRTYPADRVQKLLDFIFMNRTKPLNHAGYVRDSEYLSSIPPRSARLKALPRAAPTLEKMIIQELGSGPKTAVKLAHDTSHSYNVVSSAISRLIKKGAVVRLSPGRYSLPPKRITNAKEAVLSALREGVGKPADIASKTQIKLGTVGWALTELVKAGTIRRVKPGTYEIK